MTDNPDTFRDDLNPNTMPGPVESADADRKLKLHPFVIALVVLYFVILIGGTVGVAIWREQMDLVSKLAGSVLFSAAIIGVPPTIAWRVSRSRVVGNITCAVMVGLLFAVLALASGLAGSQAKNNAAMDEFNNNLDERYDERSDLLDRAIAGEDVADEMNEQFSEDMNRLDKLSEESSGRQATVFAVMSKVMRQIEKPSLEYNQATMAFQQVGGIDPSTMADAEDIARRLEMVQAFGAANERFASVYSSLEDSMRKGLRDENIDDDFIDFVITNWWQGARPDLISQIRQTDRELVESFTGILTTLQEAFGKWSMQGDLLLIEDASARDKYAQHFDRMNEVVARQEVLQRKVQEALEKVHSQR